MLEMVRRAWAQALAAVLGVWLMASPAVFGYAGSASAVHRIVGPVAAGFAFVAIWGHMRPLRWVLLVLGTLLIVVPGVLGVGLTATVTSIVVGGLWGGLAFVRGEVPESYGGGWSSLWTGDAGGDSRR